MVNSKIKRIILIVLDSVGIGALPDAEEYGDQGANTLGHIGELLDDFTLPNLERLGLGKIEPNQALAANIRARGVYGKMAEKSVGKDTTTGHWELAGVILNTPFPTYPTGFPSEVILPFQERIKREVLGNKAASGTVIIEELGAEHLATGKPIVYTSADSVFQIAAHEEIIPVEELYDMCRIARSILRGKHAVGRVIARPFFGQPGSFVRSEKREDFSLEPPEETMLDKIKAAGLAVLAVGKIVDIFAGRGITRFNHTINNMAGVEAILQYMASGEPGLIFANLVDFDMLYGHRRDITGYARALEEFDQRLPALMEQLTREDLLIITADHGCDPSYQGTDHTREYVPLLLYGAKIKEDVDLGIRATFADLAATITDLLGVEPPGYGSSFAHDILR